MKVRWIVGLACLVSTLAFAQSEVPKAEVYAGYSFLRIFPGGNVNAYNTNGGIGALQFNLNPMFSIVAQFGGNHAGHVSFRGPNIALDQTVFQYLFGPRVAFGKRGKLAPYAHFLVGGAHNSRSFNVPNSLLPGFTNPQGLTIEPGPTTTKIRSTQNAFAMSIGGGVDINLSHRFAVRPAQVEYIYSRFSPFNVPGLPPRFNANRTQNNFQYSAGAVFKF